MFRSTWRIDGSDPVATEGWRGQNSPGGANRPKGEAKDERGRLGALLHRLCDVRRSSRDESGCLRRVDDGLRLATPLSLDAKQLRRQRSQRMNCQVIVLIRKWP